MEYAGNGDMNAFLKTVRLSEPQIRSWLVQILWAIQYMHRMGVVHRDLKCENILLTSNYNVRVGDFGFARFVSRGRNPRAKSICGTQTYLSPELLSGAKPYNPMIVDVWAVGVVLFMMANNLPPFNDSRKKDMIRKQVTYVCASRGRRKTIVVGKNTRSRSGRLDQLSVLSGLVSDGTNVSS